MSRSRPVSLLRRLRRIQQRADVVPRGMRTSGQWAREWHMSSQHALELIRAGIRGGEIKCQHYRIRTPSGRTLRVPHYGSK